MAGALERAAGFFMPSRPDQKQWRLARVIFSKKSSELADFVNPVSHGSSALKPSIWTRTSKSRSAQMGLENESGTPLASPQRRPASPVNGAGGTTGCTDDSQARKSFLITAKIFEAIYN